MPRSCGTWHNTGVAAALACSQCMATNRAPANRQNELESARTNAPEPDCPQPNCRLQPHIFTRRWDSGGVTFITALDCPVTGPVAGDDESDAGDGPEFASRCVRRRCFSRLVSTKSWPRLASGGDLGLGLANHVFSSWPVCTLCHQE